MVPVTVTTYSMHAHPDARAVYSKLVALGETEHLHQVHAFEVERGILYVATPRGTSTLDAHTSKF